MIKYISIFWLVLRCLLVAKTENLTGFSTGLTGRSKNLDPIGNPTGAGRPYRFPSLHRTASDANLSDDPHAFHYNDYFVIGGIRTCLGFSDEPMFLWISSNSCPLNLLLVRSYQAEIIIIKRLIQGRNNVTRVQVEPRPFNQGRLKNDASTCKTCKTIFI